MAQSDPSDIVQPISQQSPTAPQPIVIQNYPSSSLGWRILAAMGWMGVFLCIPIILGQAISSASYYDTTEGVSEKYVSGSKSADDKIAIINVKGVIMEGEGYIRKQIDLVKEDKDVKAVVVRVDSPGGTVTGSDYILHHLKELKKERDIPLVVSMGSMATSGGYYVAMAVENEKDAIFAEPTTTTGSIGVIIPHYNISGLMKEYNVEDDSIMSHPRKQMLTMTREMPEEHREILQEYVNQAFGRFKDIVKEGRPDFAANPEKLDVLATGEIFTANQALDNGLVDKIGFVEEAVARAAELASIDPKTSRVVTYEQPTALFDLGLAQGKAMNWDKMLELSAPKAYYISSYLPPVMSSFPFGSR
ncbi:signal peptide peptidase SppA [Bremerella sp. JC817]|uniref:signal peptide peptidase SppA n=1 Tax=Bremerella sp. JC817 TaxID=3231756 RepID=UPI0034588004